MQNSLSRRAMLGAVAGTGAAAGMATLSAATDEPVRESAPSGSPIRTDVCVIGGGSGGVGAALAAARRGADVVLVEKNQMLGGTSSVAWVHSWEPSVGGGGIPKDIWEVMTEDPLASQARGYAAGEPRRGGTWLTWEPWAFQCAVTRLLEETGNCRVFYNTLFQDAEVRDGHVSAIHCTFAGEPVRIEAPLFIDCTADGNVCVVAGCPYRIGEDPKSLCNEPNAPAEPTLSLNSLTLLYRMTGTGVKQTPFKPEGAPKCPRPAARRTCGNGDILVNAVNMLPGNATNLRDMGRILNAAYAMVYDHFHWMQTSDQYGDFSTWTIAGVAPQIGVRESRRVMGEYILNEHDCQAGVQNQDHPDIIAITDHAVDIHGPKHKLYEVPNGAYGVPYRCLLPKDTDNLLIACRGASFTHIAASSCRLSRTMITLGQAAGNAAALALEEDVPLRRIDVPTLQERLTEQGVELS